MILVFGGTTEGRAAAGVLEEAGTPFYYSTKTGEQELTLHHGRRLDGPMDAAAMATFCCEHAIRLIVDAAHPFASQLHATIAAVAAEAGIIVVRYERIYPPRVDDITWINDYDEVPRDIGTLLATTGVQSISKLKPLEANGMRILYRILPRESSIALARKQGATDDQLCYYEDGATIDVEADAILLKESGLTGGFAAKVAAAREKGMRIIALKRPQLPASAGETVDGPHGLRRAIEHLLPEFFPLHSGLTSGTCATAAAVAATLQLLQGKGAPLTETVPVVLPDGETLRVAVSYGDGYAACTKESGDDPDVTNGIEVRASVRQSVEFQILGGEGVGTITLPGFDYPPGSPAINKVPRQMIRNNVERAIRELGHEPMALAVTISVPGGEAIARRTFNPRLGIEGGISIIGVSGIVKPFSEEAFIDSIRKCLDVAKASGTERVVCGSGAKSERCLRDLYPTLPAQAFVQYGNYIGATLGMAAELGLCNVTLGVMLGKAVKLAAGQLDTHSRRATMDREFVERLLKEAGMDLALSDITLARELWQLIPPEQLAAFVRVVIGHCEEHCRPLLPDGNLRILLIDEDGKPHPKYKDLFIDFDDTLYDTHGNAVIALRETFEAFRLDRFFPDPQVFYDAYWTANIDLWKRYSLGEITRDYLIIERFRRPLLASENLMKEEPCLIEDESILKISDRFLDFCSTKPGLLDGARELMAYLKDKGYRMHITSNGFHEVQYKKLAACGLRDYFDTIILSEDAGANKPSPQYFAYALRVSGADRATTLMIGDNLQSDVIGAQTSGIDAMLYNRWEVETADCQPAPTYAVNSLREIQNIL